MKISGINQIVIDVEGNDRLTIGALRKRFGDSNTRLIYGDTEDSIVGVSVIVSLPKVPYKASAERRLTQQCMLAMSQVQALLNHSTFLEKNT